MQQIIIILHVLVALALIALVLLQQGKGSDVGAAFGSGASNTMFGSQGATPFLVKVTGVLALVFFLTSLTLSLFVAKHNKPANLVPVPAASAPVVPSVPAPATVNTQSTSTHSGK